MNINVSPHHTTPGQIRDAAERMAEIAREQERHYHDLQGNHEALRAELASTQARNASLETENDMLRTLCLEERGKADKAFRLYTSLVAQMVSADAILRDCFRKAKQAASDFPDMSANGNAEIARQQGLEGVERAMSAAQSATAESIRDDDGRSVPGFLRREMPTPEP